MKNFIRCDDQGREVAPGDDYCIVYDPATNLEWLADMLPEQHNFESAGKAAAELNIAGSGWRLTGVVHSTYPATVGVRELGPRVCINYGPGTLSPEQLRPHTLVTVERL